MHSDVLSKCNQFYLKATFRISCRPLKQEEYEQSRHLKFFLHLIMPSFPHPENMADLQ